MTQLLSEHAVHTFPEFLRSRQLSDFLCALNENPSLGHGLPVLSSQDSWLTMFIEATKKLPYAVSVADAQVAGLPLVYVNPAFERLTGYSSSYAIGRSCRFLQGRNTEPEALDELGSSIRERRLRVPSAV